jgi:hypothetical protein
LVEVPTIFRRVLGLREELFCHGGFVSIQDACRKFLAYHWGELLKFVASWLLQMPCSLVHLVRAQGIVPLRDAETLNLTQQFEELVKHGPKFINSWQWIFLTNSSTCICRLKVEDR